MALNPHEHLRLCLQCDGFVVGGSLPVGTNGGRPQKFLTELGICTRCKGSGFANATAREAFDREHRQGAQPAVTEKDDPRSLSLLP